MKLKKDKYQRARGGSSQILYIFCACCNNFLLQYQKDGKGSLHRCYLNRIISPDIYSSLQNNPNINEPKDMPNLGCSNCNELIGTPIRYEDKRLAFRLLYGKFRKSLHP